MRSGLSSRLMCFLVLGLAVSLEAAHFPAQGDDRVLETTVGGVLRARAAAMPGAEALVEAVDEEGQVMGAGAPETDRLLFELPIQSLHAAQEATVDEGCRTPSTHGGGRGALLGLP